MDEAKQKILRVALEESEKLALENLFLKRQILMEQSKQLDMGFEMIKQAFRVRIDARAGAVQFSKDLQFGEIRIEEKP